MGQGGCARLVDVDDPYWSSGHTLRGDWVKAQDKNM